MWFVEGRGDHYPYVSDGVADYVLAPLGLLLGAGGLAVAAKRASR